LTNRQGNEVFEINKQTIMSSLNQPHKSSNIITSTYETNGASNVGRTSL